MQTSIATRTHKIIDVTGIRWMFRSAVSVLSGNIIVLGDVSVWKLNVTDQSLGAGSRAITRQK